MRNKFDETYKHIVDSYEDARKASPSQKNAYIETKKSISLIVHRLAKHFNRKHKVSIRNDAIHFLIINLHQLVALPLRIEGELDEKIIHQIHTDTESILNEAIKISTSKRESREDWNSDFNIRHDFLTLTGGDMLKSVANIYEELNLSNIKLWGG